MIRMTRKIWTLIALAALLGGFSLYLNKDWFAKDNIQISHRTRPLPGPLARRIKAEASLIDPIIFFFDRRLKLTSLKVVSVGELETNKVAVPLWNLTSDSNSAPIKEFTYGMHIPGLRPVFKGAQPDPLQPNVKYRLLVEAGPRKAEHEFVPEPRSP